MTSYHVRRADLSEAQQHRIAEGPGDIDANLSPVNGLAWEMGHNGSCFMRLRLLPRWEHAGQVFKRVAADNA